MTENKVLIEVIMSAIMLLVIVGILVRSLRRTAASGKPSGIGAQGNSIYLCSNYYSGNHYSRNRENFGGGNYCNYNWWPYWICFTWCR